MAIWRIEKLEDGWYQVMQFGTIEGGWCCGRSTPFTAPDLLLEWIVAHAKPGDLVHDVPRQQILNVHGRGAA
ncbi:MAG: hypothetical protein Q8K32_07205 [Archangium sp.]|nr:hypothetical protein [Archangium sp.]